MLQGRLERHWQGNVQHVRPPREVWDGRQQTMTSGVQLGIAIVEMHEDYLSLVQRNRMHCCLGSKLSAATQSLVIT